MTEKIITVYILCGELLKAVNILEDRQSGMNNAEVMTVVLTAALFFRGHIENARIFLKEHCYIRNMLSGSRLNRRIHSLPDSVWQNLFCILSEIFKKADTGQEYIIDSFPVPVCGNIRISRSEILKGEDYRGFIASKKRYFFGIRVHMIIAASGEPAEFVIAPGRDRDVRIFKQMNFDLPEKSVVYGDKDYNDYNFGDMLSGAAGITMRPLRKKNSVRATDSHTERAACRNFRKRVETAFSRITNLFPKNIHAVTAKGFFLKVIAFILAYSINCLTV